MQWLDVVEIEVRPGQYSGSEIFVRPCFCISCVYISRFCPLKSAFYCRAANSKSENKVISSF